MKDTEKQSDAETAGAEPEAADAQLELVRRERDEYLAHWQRAQADYQNLRRRALADQEAFAARRLEPLLQGLLLVLDYLDYALCSPAASPDARDLAAGVELTRKQLLGALEAQGVERIPTEGAFDPAVHEAVGAEPAAGRAPGTIVAVVRPGYRSGERVLRPAQVRIAAESPSTTQPGDAG